MPIYRVCVRVRPTTEHPTYFEIQFGYLLVWIVGKTAEDAGVKAAEVVERLPYEIVGERLLVQKPKDEARSDLAEFVDETKKVGISFQFLVRETGADEDGFATELEDGFES
jgi:hypothetical protein